MIFTCKSFGELTVTELYEILALRSEVFVVEQNCVYQDPDHKDLRARHCQGIHEGQLAAYTRIFDLDQSYEGFLSIGRVLVSPRFRQHGFGKSVMEYSIAECHRRFGKYPIKIGAQSYLERFYNDLGFRTAGPEYLEDGIPHQIMIRP
ncbi:GNAT family N-acetyltransferase [Leadbetterella sp. DM7]|uniref:GNAT family N-acetyltransferase n=1 Tax=Leadbetterella sp. DM7 TaxID=3235085 RepID=UPI00349EFD93